MIYETLQRSNIKDITVRYNNMPQKKATDVLK